MTELLLSKSPILSSLGLRSIDDVYNDCIEKADTLNVATGFITNQSIAELNHILSFHDFNFSINLFIGMHYLDGFTQLQYNSVCKLDELLRSRNNGKVFLSKNAFFHGKMYSFEKHGTSIASFVGSSNLGSFVGSSTDLLESDIYFTEDSAAMISENICKIINLLGTPLIDIPKITQFKAPEEKLFTDNQNVKKIKNDDIAELSRNRIGKVLRIPLKTEGKSNLNTYFGAGKIKGKYSKRNWYEVELILSVKLTNRDILPWVDCGDKKKTCEIMVVTPDGYEFECSCQGDYGKNFRSSKDLAILGRWIKGSMEQKGALTPGEPVTEEVLNKFGFHLICLQKTSFNKWFMWFE